MCVSDAKWIDITPDMMVQERPLDVDCKRLSPGEFFVPKTQFFFSPRMTSLNPVPTFCLSLAVFRPVQVQKSEANSGNISEQKLQLW